MLGFPPTPSCHPVVSVLVLSVPSSTAAPVLPPSLPCDVFFFFIKKNGEKKHTGKGITICQPAGILYIIYQKKENKHENYITQKPDGNDLQILHRLLLKQQIILLF